MNFDKADFGLYLLYAFLLLSSLFVNKYVLSVLNFIYPTIFQGWQTLIGGVLLKILLSKKCLSISSTALDKSGFISLLPSFLFFSAGIVASSKALAGINIAMFLCIQNTLNAILYLLEIAPTFRGGSGSLALCASFLTISSSAASIIFDINMTFSDSPYFWMLVYLACLAVQSLHSKIADARYNEIDVLYFRYIFSVVVLAPASLYLEEAFQVLDFPHASRYDFYAGCILSGIVGLFLNLIITNVRNKPRFPYVDSASKVMISVLAFVTFVDDTSLLVKCLVALSLLSSTFVPLSQPKEQPIKTDQAQPLLNEVE